MGIAEKTVRVQVLGRSGKEFIKGGVEISQDVSVSPSLSLSLSLSLSHLFVSQLQSVWWQREFCAQDDASLEVQGLCGLVPNGFLWVFSWAFVVVHPVLRIAHDLSSEQMKKNSIVVFWDAYSIGVLSL
jgi:hypothetical protein